MEVLVGPTYSMDVSPACGVRDRKDKVVSSSSSCLFLKGDGGGEGEDRHESGDKFESGYGSDDSSDRSSSIGDPGDTEEEDEEKENDDVSLSKGEELQKSKLCLDSLEDSLPIKRGLSNHYSGRSKSFANLSDVSTVKELGKAENPFNKRRRVLIASKWSRRSSFYSWQNPKSMPLLAALNEEDDDRDHHQQQQQRRRLQNLSSCNDHKQEDGEEEDEEVRSKTQATRFNGSRLKMGFKSQSCFSLADLQEEEEQ